MKYSVSSNVAALRTIGMSVVAATALVLIGNAPIQSAPPEGSPAPAQGPLLGPQDLTYAGAFRVPAQADLNWDHSGHGLTFDPQRNSLFVSNYASKVSEIGIPTPGMGTTAGSLPSAALVQWPTDVLRGRLSQAGNMIGGLLVDGSDLIVSAYMLYDATGSATVSHFRTSTDFSQTAVEGPVRVGPSGPGFVGGPMAHIPAAWQALMGGRALSGLCCVSIVTRTSHGPSGTVFEPSDVVGSGTQIPGQAVVQYPSSHTTLGAWDSSGTLFNSAVEMAGMVWVEGTNSVLYFGRKGDQFCYGDGAVCGDPTSSAKGDHAYPYDYYVWAYDADDLLAAKQGQLAPWDVVPYATWSFSMPFASGARVLRGAAYDPATQRVFLAEQGANGQAVVIRVLQTSSNPLPPQADGDGDGVPDTIDACPGTPAGTAVDSVGCALPAAPVDCVVSAWSAWSAWTPLSATTEQRTRTRTVTTQPSNGGSACPALTDTETRAITVQEPVIEGGGTPTTTQGSGGCVTPDPFVALGGGTCVRSKWYPPGMRIPGTSASAPTPSAPSPAPPPTRATPSPGGCLTPDPFRALGRGTCVNGDWYPPGMRIPGGAQTSTTVQSPTLATSTGGCLTPDPFVVLGGGTCVRGDWFPPGMPIPGTSRALSQLVVAPVNQAQSGAGTPEAVPQQPTVAAGCLGSDPFQATAGLLGICENGDWRPAPSVSGPGLVTALELGPGVVVWGLSVGGQFYEVSGGLEAELRVEHLTVPFEAMVRTDISGMVAGSLVIDLVEIGGRER